MESDVAKNPEPLKEQTKIENKERASRLEKNRLIVHLGRVFSGRYDIIVQPSGAKGVWACRLDPKLDKEINKYIKGERENLDDFPPESFTPKRILYDEESAQEMSMDQISTILHHEAGHAKYTNFRSMIEGQRHAKDEGHLPTSFWLTFEGIEDPRVNTLEGEESPAIDKQIRTNQAKDLQERITETSLKDRPKMLQFAYESFHRWLHGEGIPELAGTDVGKLGELAKPLLEQYFQNTDPEQRKMLQKQIWDIAKGLEKKDIEQEEKRQMAQKQRQKQGKKDQSGSGQGEQSSSQQSASGSGQRSESQSGIPSNKTEGTGSKQDQEGNRRGFLNRLRNKILGQKDNPEDSSPGEESSDRESLSGKPEKFDLSKLSEEELQQIKNAIDQLSEEERTELTKKAREGLDEEQKEALEGKLGKTMKLEKNKETGEYEVNFNLAPEKMQQDAEDNYNKALKQVEEEEKIQREKEEEERKRQEEMLRQLEAKRREKIEMEKAGFDENEQEKFQLYQSLENSMHTNVRNFKQAIEKVIPRKKEGVFEGGFFSGSKFDRRELIKKAPVGDERFYMRQVEKPIGEPRLFVGLLVDNSFSMRGQKMKEARRATIFFAKVCKDMGIPFMAAAFGDNADVIKPFGQDFDNPAERIKPKIIDATNASGGSTNMHAGIEITIKSMNEQRRKLPDSHGLIFVITDGGANAGLTGDALRDYIEENRGRLTFKAFGLSESRQERTSIQNYLNSYFGESNCAYPEEFDNLPDEAFRVLRTNLMQFQKFIT